MARRSSNANLQKPALSTEEELYKFEKSCKFFLIFWKPKSKGIAGGIDVVPRRDIPVFARNSGKECDLEWKQDKLKYPVKILQGGNDEDVLGSIAVHAYEGRFLTDDEKRRTPEIIALKVQHARQKRKDTAAKNLAQKQDAQSVMDATSALNIPTQVSTPSSNTLSSVSGVSGTLHPISRLRPTPAQRHQQTAPNMELSNGGTGHTLDYYVNIYAEGVQHHATTDALRFLEALYRTVQEHTCDIPESSWMSDVLGGLYHTMTQNEKNFKSNLKLPDEWFNKDSTGVDMFGDGQMHVPSSFKLMVEATVGHDPTWNTYVAKVLSAFYGENLKHLTAIGSGDKVGVDRRLRTSLHKFCINEFGPISSKDFNGFINLTIQNRKKMSSKKDGVASDPRQNSKSTRKRTAKHDDSATGLKAPKAKEATFPSDQGLIRSDSLESDFNERIGSGDDLLHKEKIDTPDVTQGGYTLTNLDEQQHREGIFGAYPPYNAGSPNGSGPPPTSPQISSPLSGVHSPYNAGSPNGSGPPPTSPQICSPLSGGYSPYNAGSPNGSGPPPTYPLMGSPLSGGYSPYNAGSPHGSGPPQTSSQMGSPMPDMLQALWLAFNNTMMRSAKT